MQDVPIADRLGEVTSRRIQIIPAIVDVPLQI